MTTDPKSIAEREAIVALLRGEADWQRSMHAFQAAAALSLAADKVSHGEHLEESKKR